MRDLDPTAVIVMKSLVKQGLYEKNDPDAVNLRESYGTAIIPDLQFYYYSNISKH